MSNESIGPISVLLPGARVCLFTRDQHTKDAFLALGQDWRFARVALETREGDVEMAARTYASTTSPDLVIVQTDSIDGDFSTQLEHLAGSCAEGTAAIVIGPVNDVNLYRRLVGMGVSDYLVRPVETASLGDDIASTLLEKIGARSSRMIAIVGAKGGVGATSLAQGLSWGISDKLGQKCFLLDAAGGWSTLSVGMNFEPAATLGEAARAAAEKNEDSLTRMMFNASEKLTVLSSGGDSMLGHQVKPADYEALLDMLMQTYPVVIVDLSGATADLSKTVLAKAHQIVLVTTPALPAVRAARALLQEVKHLRGNSDKDMDVVLNMTGMAAKGEVPRQQIEEGLGRKLGAVISYDAVLFVGAESEARKLHDIKGGDAVVDRLLTLVRKVLASGSHDAAASAVRDGGRDKKNGLGAFLNKLTTKS